MILNTRNKIAVALFVAPSIILVVIFVYAFLGWSAWISLTDWDTIGKMGKFNGIQNYIDLFTDDEVFIKALSQTFKLALVFIFITITMGIICAVLLDLGIRGRSLFRAIYLIPLSFSFVASATMWSWMFLPENGSINSLLKLINLGSFTQPWLTSTKQSLLSIVIVYIWQFSGFATLVYYSGIASVSEDIIDAALVDGVSTFQKYTRIILPLQKPATFTVLFLLLMYSLRVFDLVWLMTGGGPAYSSEVLATYMYRVTFNYNKFAYGASISTLMFMLSVFIIVTAVLLGNIRLRKKF